MPTPDLHNLVRRGDLARVREVLSQPSARQDANAYDDRGLTPLMVAVMGSNASPEIVSLLLDHGAEIDKQTLRAAPPTTAMALALGAGDPSIVGLLIERGGNVHYTRGKGYTALVDAVHHRDILRDEKLISLLNLLIANGAELSAITEYAESGLRVLSRIGRFDAVKVLLDAGADYSQLKWNSLLRAVALGTLEDVKNEAKHGDLLEDRDWWDRTPWLLAIQTGDVAKARLLYENGADTTARGRRDKPPLFYAIETHHLPMLNWLIEIGADVEAVDKFGTTPLMEAAENDNLQAVERLLQEGANLKSESNGQTPLSFAKTRPITLRLLEAGSDPSQISAEARRALLGLEPRPNSALLDITPDVFRESRQRRFGTSNPDEFEGKFFDGMVRSGIDAYHVAELFRKTVEPAHPVWCAQRFGQSISFLPDGRIIQIGGEHEDSYDPDFCIYNDVFVHYSGGKIRFFGYPEDVFPPTDFHTATLLNDHSIWIIGSLGYVGSRRYGETPVYRLDTNTFRIEKRQISGESPGWIYKHAAVEISSGVIEVSGGKVVTSSGGKESHLENERKFKLIVERLEWSSCD